MPGEPTYKELLEENAKLKAELEKAEHVEGLLRHSERQLADIINFLPDAMFAINLKGEVTVWNRAIEDLTGVKSEEILGKTNYEYAIPFYGIRRPVLIDLVLAWDEKTQKKYIYVKRKGDVLVSETSNPPFRETPSHFWNSASPLFDSSGNTVGAIEVIRDITEIKQTEEAMEKANFIINASPSVLFLWKNRAGWPVEFVTHNVKNLLGYNGNDFVSGTLSYEDVVYAEDLDRVRHEITTASEDSSCMEIIHTPYRIVTRDEEVKWVEDKTTIRRDESGEITNYHGIVEDITERWQMAMDLSAEKERLSVTLRSIGDAVITTDRKGRIVLMNPIAESMTGWREVDAVGLPLMDVFKIVNEKTGEPCANPVERVLASGKIIGLANHTLLIAKDGHGSPIADSGAPIMDRQGNIIGVVLVFRDITERQQMEKELLKMEKLKSIGVLAGGIAHDFNNFLTGIVGNLSLARLDVKPENPATRALDEMEEAAMRAKALTQQLLTFSRGGSPVKQVTSITDLVQESTRFALHGSNVRCDIDIDSGLRSADIDEAQITQVLHNLIINADQAMPDGGTILIRGKNAVLTADNPYALEQGEYILLSIQDQGSGIPLEHLKKVFDPYFTTKPKGSGLGLTVAYNIMAKHNGLLTVDSKFGQGARFSFLLPAAKSSQTTHIENNQALISGHGRILVMDDEEYILDLFSIMVRRLGYHVELARDGQTAIDIYQSALEAGDPYDAVIMDLTIPGGMGGKEAIQQLSEIDPDVKAIVSSGYSNDPVLANYTKYGFCGVVKKPFLMRELSQVLDAVIRKQL